MIGYLTLHILFWNLLDKFILILLEANFYLISQVAGH